MLAVKLISSLPKYLKQVSRYRYKKDDSANWTCYSAGESTPEWVMQAAESSSTPIDILSMLAESCNVKVRMRIADNKNTPLETKMMLASDESSDLRYQLAENHNIDVSILKLLAKDSQPYVACRAEKTLARLEECRHVAIKMQPLFDATPVFSAAPLFNPAIAVAYKQADSIYAEHPNVNNKEHGFIRLRDDWNRAHSHWLAPALRNNAPQTSFRYSPASV